MASQKSPYKQQIDELVNRRKDRWKAEGRSTDAIEAHAGRVKSQADRIEQATRSSTSPSLALARVRLVELKEATTDLLVMIGPRGSEGHQTHPPTNLGNIARHGQQEDRNSSDVEARQLWSEHVIPVGMASILLEQIGLEKIERKGPEDKHQHTILIYRSAAKIKDRGHPSSDIYQINILKWMSILGRPFLEGSNRHARRVKSGGAEVFARIWAHFDKYRSKFRSTLLSKLPGIMAGRVTITNNAVREDHEGAANAAKRNARNHDTPDTPLPTPDKVRTAAALQAEDIVDILVNRLSKK